MRYYYQKLLQDALNKQSKGNFWIRNVTNRIVTISDLSDKIPPYATVNLTLRNPNNSLDRINSSKHLKERFDSGELVRVSGPPPATNSRSYIDTSKQSISRPPRSSVIVEALPFEKDLNNLQANSNNGSLRPELDSDDSSASGPQLTRPPDNAQDNSTNTPMEISVPSDNINSNPIENIKTSVDEVIPDDKLCQGITKDDKRCKSYPKQGGRFCAKHLDQDLLNVFDDE